MKARIICLLLGALLLLTSCISCQQKDESPEETVTESSADSESNVEDDKYISLVKGGEAQFIIVCENADMLSAAENLSKTLKHKTGVPFTVRKFALPTDSLKKLYVGVSYNDVMESDTPKPYGTYGVLEKDGDLYICADTVAGLWQCINEFSASITDSMVSTDADGRAEVNITEKLFFVHEPEQNASAATLLGAPISEYRIVISSRATDAEKHFAQVLLEKIRSLLFLDIPIVTDATAVANREIVVGNTTREGSADFYSEAPAPFTYALKSKGDDLYIGYSDVYCMNDVIGEFLKLVSTDNNSISVEGSLTNSKYRVERESESDVRVITANVLYVAWDGNDPNREKYKTRMELTADYFNLYGADFIGLQECPEIMRKAMTPYLDSKWAWVTFESDNTNIDFFPVLYNADKWQVETSGTDERTGDQTQRPWGYVWVTFSRIDDPTEKYTLINLHYTFTTWQDTDPEGYDYYRTDLAKRVNAEIKKQLSQSPSVPVIVTGDYNGNPGSDVYEAQVEGIAMDTSYRLTDNTNGSDTIDNICVTTELVDVVAHRVNTDDNRGIMSDHAYHYADIRLKSATNS